MKDKNYNFSVVYTYRESDIVCEFDCIKIRRFKLIRLCTDLI